jgi:hypothetical protein
VRCDLVHQLDQRLVRWHGATLPVGTRRAPPVLRVLHHPPPRAIHPRLGSVLLEGGISPGRTQMGNIRKSLLAVTVVGGFTLEVGTRVRQ